MAWLLLLALTGPAVAAERPLWEVGLGLAPSTFPDYRGSEEQQVLLLPFPYVIYRGERLKVDRRGIRGLLFDTDRLELDISVSGSLPVNSDDNPRREGMPDLDPTAEIGPALDIVLLRTAGGTRLDLTLPVRRVIASDLTDIETAGWLFHPQLDLDIPSINGGWHARLMAGPLFADEDYHDFYYEVAPRFATSARPAYDAEAGYSGTSVWISGSRRFGDLWLGGFLRYDYLQGATFEDSPLVETDHSLMAGLGAAWILGRSSRMVEVAKGEE